MQLNHSIWQESETTPLHKDRHMQAALNCASHKYEPYSGLQLSFSLSAPTQRKIGAMRLQRNKDAWWPRDAALVRSSLSQGPSFHEQLHEQLGTPASPPCREAGTESRRMVSARCLAGFCFCFFLIFWVNPQGGRGVSLYRTRVSRFWIKCNHQMYGKEIKGSFSIILHLKASQNSLHVLLYLEKTNNYTYQVKYAVY